jgi:hypothetical protein
VHESIQLANSDNKKCLRYSIATYKIISFHVQGYVNLLGQQNTNLRPLHVIHGIWYSLSSVPLAIETSYSYIIPIIEKINILQ